MSFGFGVGDVIAVSTLARNIWGRFRDSSDQFNAIQTEVAGLYLALDDIANNLPKLQVTDKKAKDLSALMQGCRSVLEDTNNFVRKNESLVTESSGLGSKTQKAWKKLKWDSTTVNELRDRMIANATYLNAFNTSLASQASRATNDKVDIIAEDTRNLRSNQSQQERETVLKWLSPLNFATQQSDLSSRRQERTGSWLLESQKFQEWVSERGKTLVCQGMPGAGKTMLASLVIDHLQQKFNEEKVATAYIYCDYKRQEEQTPLNLLASVTKQLLQHQDSIPGKIQETYKRHHEHESRPGFEEFSEMTGSSMADFSRIFLIVDALDELGNAGQVRQTLLERLHPLQDLHHINLMTTSRYIAALALDFHQPLCMDVRASPEDIRRYVEGHISDLPRCVKMNSGLPEAIANAIVDAVEGMFLLAQLHMDSLRDKPSSKLIKKALEKLPTGSNALDMAYHGAMQRVDDQMEGFRVLAKQLLGWLTYSERLMTVEEVQHALAIEPGASEFDKDNLGDVDEIVSFCAGLVIVDEETQIIRLVHYTTQEYFRRNGGTILACAQEDIAISCLTYLMYEEFGDGWLVDSESDEVSSAEAVYGSEEVYEDEDVDISRNEDKHEGDYEGEDEDEDGIESLFSGPPLTDLKPRAQAHSFLEYAASHWAVHARVCEQQNVKELLMEFAKDDRRVSSASQVMLDLDKRHVMIEEINNTKSCSPLSAMHVTAYLGFEAMISELLNHGFAADIEDSTHRTPLWWAAWQGHEAVVELLLSQNYVNVNNRGFSYQRGAPRYTKTPLGAAAGSGKDKIVKLFIQREDVDVNLLDGYGDSPLHSAAWRGHSAVVEMLLTRRDIEVNSKNVDGQTPLLSAAYHGKEETFEQLLKQKDVQVNTADNIERTPLFWAVFGGYESIVELLLACSDIEVNARDAEGQHPLSMAARMGHDTVVKLLLSHSEVEVNSKDHKGKTPLWEAAANNRERVVKLLLSYTEVEVNAADDDGKTPLTQAILEGSAGALKLLCAHPNVDLDPRDNEGRDVSAVVKDAPEEWLAPKREECLEILRTAIEKRSQSRLRTLETVPS